MIHNIDKDFDIIPEKGIGNIRLGTSIYYFQELYEKQKKDQYIDIKPTINPNLIYLTDVEYCDFVTFSFNCNGILSIITLKNGYEGKLWGTITLNSQVKDIFNTIDVKEFEIEDGFLVINNYTKLYFFLGEDVPDFSEYHETKDLKIKEILIIDKELLSHRPPANTSI
ncbi:hypothetical protein FUAX_55150 (plasmid) [Fulvitalea axinellae]|uniref:Uncharacterized protein n=1 Tax=Fulvitalea axinellae TaxID=1182444 RepID=A0AAU9CYQ4_9BACT|nr:hypothetical protein FUAX_55150 [Fulvitalea axinellae]